MCFHSKHRPANTDAHQILISRLALRYRKRDSFKFFKRDIFRFGLRVKITHKSHFTFLSLFLISNLFIFRTRFINSFISAFKRLYQNLRSPTLLSFDHELVYFQRFAKSDSTFPLCFSSRIEKIPQPIPNCLPLSTLKSGKRVSSKITL